MHKLALIKVVVFVLQNGVLMKQVLGSVCLPIISMDHNNNYYFIGPLWFRSQLHKTSMEVLTYVSRTVSNMLWVHLRVLHRYLALS